jgi:hypothetical protein
MGSFRDYRRVIQTALRCCDTTSCAATRNQPELLVSCAGNSLDKF